jgi:hypothetical protein
MDSTIFSIIGKNKKLDEVQELSLSFILNALVYGIVM